MAFVIVTFSLRIAVNIGKLSANSFDSCSVKSHGYSIDVRINNKCLSTISLSFIINFEFRLIQRSYSWQLSSSKSKFKRQKLNNLSDSWSCSHNWISICCWRFGRSLWIRQKTNGQIFVTNCVFSWFPIENNKTLVILRVDYWIVCQNQRKFIVIHSTELTNGGGLFL